MLANNSSGQWLALGNLEKVPPDLLGFPDWDHNLRIALPREPELFFATIVPGDSSAPDLLGLRDWEHTLRIALQREAVLLFASIVREDRSALDLLNADYTFVNERLAKHYGIPNIYGSYFRRVTIPDPNRRGLLGQGS